MQILVNDERVDCEAGEPLAALLSRLGWDKPGIALALNQQIVPQAQWADTLLQDGDSLLVFQAIAGG